VEELLPRLVACAASWWKAALHRLLHSRTSSVTPENLMVALHKLTPSGTLTMKKIVDAIELCFNDRAVFTTQVPTPPHLPLRVWFLRGACGPIQPIPPLSPPTHVHTPKALGLRRGDWTRLCRCDMSGADDMPPLASRLSLPHATSRPLTLHPPLRSVVVIVV
jgi:hypothetical protein